MKKLTHITEDFSRILSLILGYNAELIMLPNGDNYKLQIRMDSSDDSNFNPETSVIFENENYNDDTENSFTIWKLFIENANIKNDYNPSIPLNKHTEKHLYLINNLIKNKVKFLIVNCVYGELNVIQKELISNDIPIDSEETLDRILKQYS